MHSSGLSPSNAAPRIYGSGCGLPFPSLPSSTLETTERLEQLRFLENGFNLYVEPTDYDTVGVDTEEDLKLVETMLLAR